MSRRVVKDAHDDDILEELQPVSVVYLLLHAHAVQRDLLVEAGGLAQKVAVVCLMRQELGFVYREMSRISEDDAIGWWGQTSEPLLPGPTLGMPELLLLRLPKRETGPEVVNRRGRVRGVDEQT